MFEKYLKIYLKSHKYRLRYHPFNNTLQSPGCWEHLWCRDNFFNLKPDETELLDILLILGYENGFPQFHKNIDFWHINLWSADYILNKQSVDVKDSIRLMTQKREDYGDRPFKISKTIGLMARCADKLCRYQNLRNKEQKFESRQDSMMDFFNYSLMGLEMCVD